MKKVIPTLAFVFLALNLSAQLRLSSFDFELPSLKIKTTFQSSLLLDMKYGNEKKEAKRELSQSYVVLNKKALHLDTGLFCRLDSQLDKTRNYKLRFRLGEYHYTHQQEYGLSY